MHNAKTDSTEGKNKKFNYNIQRLQQPSLSNK